MWNMRWRQMQKITYCIITRGRWSLSYKKYRVPENNGNKAKWTTIKNRWNFFPRLILYLSSENPRNFIMYFFDNWTWRTHDHTDRISYFTFVYSIFQKLSTVWRERINIPQQLSGKSRKKVSGRICQREGSICYTIHNAPILKT